MGRLLVVLFVIAVIAVVVIGIMLAAQRRAPKQEDPREILKRRYAAGEIDEDEYLRRMSGLDQDW
ncbi:SHOCT domain-containing protein [Nonomuraea soli]|uniref:Putative membrane protein n=1 Tax=Nonomuraea soli TaxID=1032476 RepID=A0A7W0HS51_9ACTN|nr:SHOCT domain-containing protein [Nonomuraea soli]MBA2893527.1 putative membrane protein [Nonomuraea soli]